MASSRPHRKCVRRLSPDAISEILSDFSDQEDDPDDPDFELDPDTTTKAPRIATKRLLPSDYSDSSNDSVKSSKKVVPDEPKPKVPTGTIFTVVKPGFNTTGVDIIQHTPTDQGPKYFCCVKDCSSAGLSNLDGLWLFGLPEESESRELWVQKLPIDFDANRPNSPRICFRHFDSSKFVKRQQRLLGLLKDAVPSVDSTVVTPVSSKNNSKHAPRVARNSLPSNMNALNPPTSTHVQPVIVKLESAPSAVSRGTLLTAPAPVPAGSSGQPTTPKLGAASSAPTAAGSIGAPATPKLQAVSSSVASSNTYRHGPKNEVFIDLTSDEPVTNTSGAAHTSTSFAAANGGQVTESVVSIDDEAYEFTLEDIEEELPWVVPDMHWDSTLKDDKLHLIWNNSPDQNRCKKVVLDKDLAVHVYVGEKEVVLGVKKVTTVESLKALFTELGEL